MADNDLVKNSMTQEYYGQKAPSQANRTEFVPGKVGTREDEANWPKDFTVPIAGRGGSTHTFERQWRIRRNIICDQDRHLDVDTDITKDEKTTNGDWRKS